MMKKLKFFALTVSVFCIANSSHAQNPTVINDSLIVNQRLYAKEKLVVDLEAKFKEDIKVLGTARLQGDVIVSGVAKFESNVKMTGLGTPSAMASDDKILIILPNGQLKTVGIGALMTAGSQPIACLGGDVANPLWAHGLNKIYHECPVILTGLGTAAPAHKLHVVGLSYSSKGFLAGHSGANADALINAYAQSSFGNLLQLGVKVGSGSQEVRLTVTNDGEVDWKNLGTDPSLTIHNGDGHAIVVYGNAGGSKIFQLEDNGLLRTREIRIDATSWADHVFHADYKLPKLKDVAKFIDENNHLPGIPSATELEENGINVGEMQTLQMQKIEELTLYMIEMDQKMEAMQAEINDLKKENETLKNNR
jgi:hypothetical protein